MLVLKIHRQQFPRNIHSFEESKAKTDTNCDSDRDSVKRLKVDNFDMSKVFILRMNF